MYTYMLAKIYTAKAKTLQVGGPLTFALLLDQRKSSLTAEYKLSSLSLSLYPADHLLDLLGYRELLLKVSILSTFDLSRELAVYVYDYSLPS